MKVLAVASEIYPFVKTGGLADVVGALPLALGRLGVETRTLVPGYPAILAALKGRKRKLGEYAWLFGGPAVLLQAKAAGLDLIVLHAPHLFERPGGVYADAAGRDWQDNAQRFAALARAGADLAAGGFGSYRPDVVHVHDWQAAMTPAFIRYGPEPRTPSVVTVHNLAFQGRFGPGLFGELGLPDEAMALDGVEYYGGVGYLKAGLQSASAITTVSPTYAREICTPSFGMGLDGLLNARSDRLFGILNGIDIDVWNPASDPLLAAPFDGRRLKARAANRRAVEERFGLQPGEGPIVCVISRLTWQKGMDLLVSMLDAVVAEGVRLAILGTGDQALEGAILAASARHGGRLGVIIGYDEGLSHLMQGGCDAIVIPSRFEPCGLTQLYGLRYGCVPVVARTGGLADTVIDANEAAVGAGVATGFVFAPESGDALVEAMRRVVRAHADHGVWTSLQKQGMKADISWDRSAAKYAALYRSLVTGG